MMLAKSLQSAAGNAAGEANYIEDVFSTYLYTGNGSTQTITNGIDLAGEGGLVWIKRRDSSGNNWVGDTVRGRSKLLITNSTGAEQTSTVGSDITSFNSNGFSLGPEWVAPLNTNGGTYASWTFRKQPKFFDVVTYTGDSVAGRAIAHNLGSAPGCVIIKRTNTASDWGVWHRGNGGATDITGLTLNATSAAAYPNAGVSASFTSTTFKPGDVYTAGGANYFNQSGDTYVAYLFAHNAGGFGLSGEDNVISCGSYTGTGVAGLAVTLGYEPQWILWKNASQNSDWNLFDNMRGMTVSGDQVRLRPNLSNAEGTYAQFPFPTATGFIVNEASAPVNGSGDTHIYIAIRRGPMKVPESGTSVFFPTAWTGTSTTRVNTTGFVTDLNISRMRNNFSTPNNLGAYWVNRLAGISRYLRSDATAAEAQQTDGLTSFASNTAVTFGTDTTVQAWNFDNNYRNYSFRRAPSVFDVVCYTGTGSARTVAHNLTVAPELMIVKWRSGTWDTRDWAVYHDDVGANYRFRLQSTAAADLNTNIWNNTNPTNSVFSLGTDSDVNYNTSLYVAYLFASAPGVSKVGSYTGNGSSQTINCGFLAGARFVMIKAASTTGNWVFTDVNGINTGNDRTLYMNNADVEGFAYDWIDIDSTGFIVNETAVIAANTNGVSYIFLAIA